MVQTICTVRTCMLISQLSIFRQVETKGGRERQTERERERQDRREREEREREKVKGRKR